MATVNSVVGTIRSDDLGRTLMHEHVITLSPGVRENWPETFDAAVIVNRASGRLRAARENGIKTIVDLTTVDLGRDIALVRNVAELAGMQVIAATGFWLDPPRYFRSRPVTTAAQLLIRDIVVGIQGTGIKAGIIKAASDSRLVEGPAEVAFRAAAIAHRETGLPISTHANARNNSGLDQQRILAQEGVDLTRVIIGHSGDSDDLEYLKRILDRGSYLGMDRFGLEAIGNRRLLSFVDRVRIIAALCREGYAERMVLSHDASGYSDAREPDMEANMGRSWHFSHIPLDVVPALRDAGVSESDCDAMLCGNPRAIFERDGPY